MTDPVYEKLKSDAGSVLRDFWRAITLRGRTGELPDNAKTPVSDSSDKPAKEPAKEAADSQLSGLCYFHLN